MTIAWTIAGSDSGGHAGIQADLQTFHALGVHGCSVITAVTAQNSLSVNDIHYLPAPQVQSQINTLGNDLPAQAIKLGMLGEIPVIKAIHDFLKSYAGQIILDPVFISTSGKKLFSADLPDYLAALKSLFPFVDLLTPNRLESESILNKKIISFSDIKNAATEFLNLGVKSVLIKGGHFNLSEFCHDYWTNGKEAFWLNIPRIANHATHGTGCTLSSAITACLAQGYDIKDAVTIGKMYVTQAIRHAKKQGQGLTSLAHRAWPEDQADLPYLTTEPLTQLRPAFPACTPKPLGLYPIVDRSQWLHRLLPLGVSTIQLRIKDQSATDLENEIKQAIHIGKQYDARLFINDYWQLALKHGAYGVHLGQEDLQNADIDRLLAAGIRLGISSHCYYEVARAHSLHPSYIACGPIFPTATKQMPFSPQGLAQLARWQRTLQYPIVAIGGINSQRFQDIRRLDIDGIAMISEICNNSEPERVTQALLQGYN